LADRDLLGARREREHVVVDQRVVEDDVGRREEPRRAHRQEVDGARACADEIDAAHQSAATATGSRRWMKIGAATALPGSAPVRSSCGSRSTLNAAAASTHASIAVNSASGSAGALTAPSTSAKRANSAASGSGVLPASAAAMS